MSLRVPGLNKVEEVFLSQDCLSVTKLLYLGCLRESTQGGASQISRTTEPSFLRTPISIFQGTCVPQTPALKKKKPRNAEIQEDSSKCGYPLWTPQDWLSLGFCLMTAFGKLTILCKLEEHGVHSALGELRGWGYEGKKSPVPVTLGPRVSNPLPKPRGTRQGIIVIRFSTGRADISRSSSITLITVILQGGEATGMNVTHSTDGSI